MGIKINIPTSWKKFIAYTRFLFCHFFFYRLTTELICKSVFKMIFLECKFKCS
jgi:hypothetical protein